MSIAKGIALVTGSAQGIGRSIALRLARDGFDVALNDLPSQHDQLRATASDIKKIGQRTHLVPGDVSSEQDVKGAIRSVAEQLGGLDVMVANVGVCPLSDLLSTKVDDWDRIMAINARGAFLCYRHAAVQMIAQGRGGRIIGGSSMAGKRGFPTIPAYSASKFAIRGLTQSAALELGRHKITVNSYAPGVIATEMTDSAIGMFAGLDQDYVKWIEDFMRSAPVKQNGQPEDVASVVSFLASKDAHFITGQCISVDAGLTLS